MKSAFAIAMLRVWAVLLALFLCSDAFASEHSDSLHSAIEAYLRDCPAEVGVAVITTEHDTIEVNRGAYPMNSILKLYQSLPTALEMGRLRISPLDTCVIARADIDPATWSPMLLEHPQDTLRLPFSDLFAYALTQSDNNACDVLFRRFLSPSAVEEYWHSQGIKDVQIKWDEAQMHENPERSADNCCTPLAAAQAISEVSRVAMFSSQLAVSLLFRYLTSCATGQTRITAGIDDALIAHKTGTGFPDADGFPTGVNDAAFVILPDGRSYAIAVMVKSSRVPLAETEGIIADVSRIVYRFLSGER